MSNQPRNRFNGIQRFQLVMHLGMGLFYIFVGLLIIYVNYFGTMELPQTLAYALGGLMIAYGIFRLWRGIVGLRQKS